MHECSTKEPHEHDISLGKKRGINQKRRSEQKVGTLENERRTCFDTKGGISVGELKQARPKRLGVICGPQNKTNKYEG